MSDSHRICETCVYCSFAGNCDRYNNPLTSIEQPACGAYEIHPLLAENAKLREEIAKWERLAVGIDLPEYPVTQFKPKDLERENDKLQDENARLRSCLSDDAENARMIMGENAKLRELVQKMMRFMEDGDWCTTCEVAKECDAQECDAQEQYEEDCLMRGVFHNRMRELGVEVDDGCDLV